jgi:hypothetical protein
MRFFYVPVIKEKIMKKPASSRATIIKVHPSANQKAIVGYTKAVLQAINFTVLNVSSHRSDQWVGYQIIYAVQIICVGGGIRFPT